MLYNNKGFTLVEMMVVLFIFLVITAALFTVLGAGRNTWLTGTTYIEIQQELKKTKEWISKEIAQGRYSTADISGVGNSIIDFEIPASVVDGGYITWQPIRYYIGGLNNRQLLRDSNGNVRVLANNIASIVFTQNATEPWLINITVTANKQTVTGRPISSTLSFNIKLRN